MKSSFVKSCVKILGSSLILTAIFFNLDIEAFVAQMKNVDLLWFFTTVVLVVATMVGGGARWASMIRLTPLKPNNLDAIGLFFAGTLINQGLPSLVGGDLFRIMKIKKSLYPLEDSRLAKPSVSFLQKILRSSSSLLQLTTLTLADRGIGLYSNNLMSLYALIYLGDFFGTAFFYAAIIILIIHITPIVLGRFLLFLPLLAGFHEKILKVLGLVRHPVFQLRHGSIAFFVLVSMLIHLVSATALYCSFRAFGVSPPPIALILGLTLASLLIVVPVSVAGWGLRESTLVAVVGAWQIEVEAIVAASMMFGLAHIISSLPGLYWLSTSKLHGEKDG